MRIADTHSLPVMLDMETTTFLGRDVFSSLTNELEWHVSQKKKMIVRLSDFDVYVINRLYPMPDEQLEVKLANVLEDILSVIELPYILFPIMRGDLTRLTFYARVKDRLKYQ